MHMEGERERRTSSGSYGRGSGSQKHGGGGKNGRGYRPSRDQKQDRGTRSGRGKSEYGGGGMMKTPVILTRNSESNTAAGMMPGAISIMQREHPLSPRSAVPSSGGLPTPSNPPPKQRDDYTKRPSRSRSEGLSSSPSNYTPLQPTARTTRGGPDNSTLTSNTSSHLSGGNEMIHPIKIIDRGFHWEDKGLDFMQDQSDFLVVGVVGKTGVGKSTVMSLLAGTRTGAGKPFMFRTQSREVWESGGCGTCGVDMLMTGERVLLLDTQPILSEVDDLPDPSAPDSYLEPQVTLFLYSVCHVILVVMDNMEHIDLLSRFLTTIEQMKTLSMEADSGEKQHYPQLVFVLNHASPDDFQPLSLREMHSILANDFQRSKVTIGSGVCLAKSGLVPVGRGFPEKRPGDKTACEDVNFHLLPSNTHLTDSYGVYATSRPEKAEINLNPMVNLLTSYEGHPSFSLLAETLRNQVFGISRPPIRKSAAQMTEKEWFDYAKRTWLSLKKTDLLSEYDRT